MLVDLGDDADGFEVVDRGVGEERCKERSGTCYLTLYKMFADLMA